jgi:LDH2 family malate/lactate/ureidoglycolate dehydrogenase
MPIFSKNYLKRITLNILKASGALENEAQTIADFIIESNLAGQDSQGIIRLTDYLDLLKRGEARPGSRIKIIKETPSTAVIDGKWGLGHIVASKQWGWPCKKLKRTQWVLLLSIIVIISGAFRTI